MTQPPLTRSVLLARAAEIALLLGSGALVKFGGASGWTYVAGAVGAFAIEAGVFVHEVRDASRESTGP